MNPTQVHFTHNKERNDKSGDNNLFAKTKGSVEYGFNMEKQVSTGFLVVLNAV